MDRHKPYDAARFAIALAASIFVGCQEHSPPTGRCAAPTEPQHRWVDSAARPVDDGESRKVVPTYFPNPAPSAPSANASNPAPEAGTNGYAYGYGYSAQPPQQQQALPQASATQFRPTQFQSNPSPRTNPNAPGSVAAPPQYAPAPQYIVQAPQHAGQGPQYGVQAPQYFVIAPQNAQPQYVVPQFRGSSPQYVAVLPQYPGQPPQYVVAAPSVAPAMSGPALAAPASPALAAPTGREPTDNAPTDRAPVPNGASSASAANAGDLAMINRQAAERVREGFRLAERGAMHSAREEFIKSLRLVAQAIDAQQSTNIHSEALKAGLTALREARDFSSERGSLEEGIDVRHVVQGHRTPVLKLASLEGVNSLVAQQKYLTYAQEQLAIAAAGQPSASLALFGVGRVAALAAAAPGNAALGDIGTAAASYQAALVADGNNYRASNELGVILGNCGRLEAARDVFRRSLAASPQSVTWRNLSVVHQRLGQPRLAEQALAQAGPPTEASKLPVDIAWLDANTFSQMKTADGSISPSTASNSAPVAGSPGAGNINTARSPNGNQTPRR